MITFVTSKRGASDASFFISISMNFLNVLVEVSQTGKQRHIPYRDSRLTFLLQESLGGNAKLAMICAVSPCAGNSNSLIADSHVRDSSVQPPEEKNAQLFCRGLPDKGSLRNLVRHGSSCPISDPLAGFSREISGEDMHGESGNGSVICVSPSCLSIVRTDGSPVLKSPTPSFSPRINNSRKSLRTSSMLSASQKDLNDDNKSELDAVDMFS
ncbi:hypothetical protein Patl1_37538 [Pistacia atlantica]|nr:hypothetical protein Patl1_37538 [Pistacia atlantica]